MASAQHSTQTPRYSLPPPPNANNDFRLPSLKDLNFQYKTPTSQQDTSASPPNGPPQSEHNGQSQEHAGRHPHAQSWARPSPQGPHMQAPPPPQHQHHHLQDQAQPKYVSKHDNGGYLTPGVPLSAQTAIAPGSVNIGPGNRGGDDARSQTQSKRPRAAAAAPPHQARDGRPANAAYIPSQYTQYPSQQAPPAAPYPSQIPSGSGAHSQMHHQPTGGPQPPQPHPGYAPYPPQGYIPARPHSTQHQQPTPQPSPVAQHPPAHHQFGPAPPQHNPWESQQQHQQQQPSPQHVHPPAQPQPQPQQPQAKPSHMSLTRTTPLIPTSVDGHRPGPSPALLEKQESTMIEIVKHCTALYSFASRYAQLQASVPSAQPQPAEVADMAQRATHVVRLLEELRRMIAPPAERAESASGMSSSDSHRPPKRPWEDVSQGGSREPEGSSYNEQPGSGSTAQTTAEQDMETIRHKRAATTSSGGPAGAGQPKSKYRKRSSGQRATPPGKCHSCNIRETPEWRRGPDGARTLCNACGLHYAKLMRKRDKATGPDGQPPRIDMETLRASARAADLTSSEKSHARRQSTNRLRQPVDASSSTSPRDAPPPHTTTHQGSFQLVSMVSLSDDGHMQSTQGQQGMMTTQGQMVPPPPWATSGPGRGPYVQENMPHQSFMRSSQPSASSGASPH
ncbi:hypothetical protein PLICRDRAFT_701268 [Plicaturopsis crispa FD-325 SS-3]|uniref:GATA-type domain-containing protein n=1 Tax=Plicaturopsis crispa FD-325 SS-3 TaxID=944288 RepID=A0A0C9SL92_PLICR|nr:hypothetical protein PLICRDRAFT_701268 [Plicaturopsis crispa FD-325 SS-3]